MSIAIFSMGGGGTGAALDITAYTTLGARPSSAATGAIAVITSQTITAAKASGTAPASPASGNVWVWTGGQSLAPFAFGDQVVLSPRVVYQWSGSAWVLRVSYVYTGSAWVEITLYVYDNGAELLSTVSIGNRSRTNNTLTKYSTYMRVFREFGGGASTQISVMTDTALDLTDISTIKIRCSRSGNTGSAALKVGVDRTSYTYAATASIATGTDIEITLDVSALNGVYYIGMFMEGNSTSSNDTVDITKIQMIK